MAEAINRLIGRTRAETGLREPQQRFRNASQNAPIGIAVADLEGRFLEVNRALCQLLGYSEQQLLLTTVQAITHPHDVEDFLAGIRELLAGEATRFQTEQRYLHADGHLGWALVSVSLLRDSRRRPLHYVLGIDDISASHRNERLRAVTSAVTRRLGEAVTEDAAYRTILQGLCEDLGWNIGQLWIRDRAEVLRLRDSWQASSPEVAEAARVNGEAGTFRGIDLAGRVLAAAVDRRHRGGSQHGPVGGGRRGGVAWSVWLPDPERS